MAYNTYSNLDLLERRARERTRRRPAGSDQVAAINMIRRMGAELARLSQEGRLPKEVPEEVYPGGALPPGDVVKVEHYTGAPEFQAFDPSLWGSRGGSRGYGNAEAQRFLGNPDIHSTQFYLPEHGSIPEQNIINQPNVRKIEGYLPGMYNLDKDPDNLKQAVREEYQRQHPNEPYFLPAPEGENLVAREAARRGYSGTYHEAIPGNPLGTRLDVTTPVDLTGAAPNIPAMRRMLGRDVEASAPETVMDPRATAQVTTETMPGPGVMPERYKLYEDNPTAGAMLHRDYEQLLRDPDGGSVVGRLMGVEASHRQSTGAYQGQTNPMVQQRVTVTQPNVDASADPETIKTQAQLSAHDKAKMDALAAVEGKLRDQDAAAWGYPIHMVEEGNMPLAGVPWDMVDAAILRSPMIGPAGVKKVADEIYSIPVPEGYNAGSMQDLIAVGPAPDGGGGVFLMNIGLPNDEFQKYVRVIRGNHPFWASQGDMKTEWGKYDGNYITDYDEAIQGLPRDLRQKAERTIETLQPMTSQIKSYHDDLRKPPEAPAEDAVEKERIRKRMEELRGQF